MYSKNDAVADVTETRSSTCPAVRPALEHALLLAHPLRVLALAAERAELRRGGVGVRALRGDQPCHASARESSHATGS
jgi:hypothetical protein